MHTLHVSANQQISENYLSHAASMLQVFLNLHGYTYVRLDGTTKPEQRQILMQRYNTNPKLFIFILSTRSGGVGMNLTGADTVIFYDSDWNPAMDAQVWSELPSLFRRAIHGLKPAYLKIGHLVVFDCLLTPSVQPLPGDGHVNRRRICQWRGISIRISGCSVRAACGIM